MVILDVPAPLLASRPAAPAALEVPRHGAPTLRDEAVSLYAAGELPPACERFRRAAADEPGRADTASCFETWAWRAMRERRPDEAGVLFAEGLRERPGTPGLLQGLGIAAIHAGRLQQAIAPLESAFASTDDSDLRLLLARLYDQQDDGRSALDHVRAVLAREPRNPRALALLARIEHEHVAESGWSRAATAHFVLKWREGIDGKVPRAVLSLLEAAHTKLERQLGYRPSERVTTILHADQQFCDLTRGHAGAGGLFDGKIRLPSGAALAAGSALERLIVHEYAHAAIHDLSRGRAARWLHEGLAQLLEGAPVDPALAPTGAITLAGLDALIADPDPARARMGYDVALWVVADLSARRGMGQLRAVLDRIATGEPLTAALSRIYGLRLSELESQWRYLPSG
jgi:tetratricopeptide (TPR) repeat protein